MNKKNKEQNKGEKTYQIRPQFKDKFRPQEAKEKIEKIVKNKLQGVNFNPQELHQWCKDITDETKKEMVELGKDKRYKYFVQCILGQSYNQGVRVGSR